MRKQTPIGLMSKQDANGIKLCISAAWIYGTLSRGRAAELALAIGCPFSEIEELKFLEEKRKQKCEDPS